MSCWKRCHNKKKKKISFHCAAQFMHVVPLHIYIYKDAHCGLLYSEGHLNYAEVIIILSVIIIFTLVVGALTNSCLTNINPMPI